MKALVKRFGVTYAHFIRCHLNTVVAYLNRIKERYNACSARLSVQQWSASIDFRRDLAFMAEEPRYENPLAAGTLVKNALSLVCVAAKLLNAIITADIRGSPARWAADEQGLLNVIRDQKANLHQSAVLLSAFGAKVDQMMAVDPLDESISLPVSLPMMTSGEVEEFFNLL
jgi:hypothetical protein